MINAPLEQALWLGALAALANGHPHTSMTTWASLPTSSCVDSAVGTGTPMTQRVQSHVLPRELRAWHVFDRQRDDR